ncbi:FAD dependent oxidoreductase [Rubrobacter radiotolerans]|uniref:D-amino-acid oxidase n=1 Tax=Rubrobacter radiotolerans TaxID=42256 RepID=A0A023X6Z5_RUBRA|nr:FAD-dependent oxidoreductase [Rubrobacter radiotolerans]AHY47800.1 FAD dependent oxidoreductase [Rubrobacter radiotolerans]MDX5892439.1 FAD-dependent oxidoreductase [Rubrobacter radiotolerans]SMC07730.1 D-amino-acid:oxygen oxidoreductase [Rubrobacter radiotolerans DSM 5868]
MRKEETASVRRASGGSAAPFDVAVVGGGVAGLSTAVRLLEIGRSVCVLSADPPQKTTSNLAAAVWYPTEFGRQDGVLAWARRAYDVFRELSGTEGSGVVMRETLMLLRTPDEGSPWWAEAIGGVERVGAGDLRSEWGSGYAGGYRFEVPLVEMPVYLPWLLKRFIRSGGVFEERRIESLREAGARAGMVVNCSGIGARELCGDREVRPARGQVVRVENPGLSVSVRDEENPGGRTYIHPRTEDCILGGTFESGNWDTTPDPETARRILARCSELVPELAGARVLEHHVGLRPVRRGGVRLERDPERPATVHNYGHGGAGVTLSWGCAERAVELVESAERELRL